MKKDAYYFSHDSNSQDDPKCMVLIDQLGMEGYGIFWALIEKLRNEKDYKLPLLIANSLAKRWGTSKEKVEAVIKNYSLFLIENDLFFSVRLQRSMQEKTDRARLSASYRNYNANALQPNSERIAIGMRNDAIKEKKSKVKEMESKVNNRANALVFPNEKTQPTSREFNSEYQKILIELSGKEMKEVWIGIKNFITEAKPDIPDPYIDAWNLFVQTYKLPKVDLVTGARRKKVKIRIYEDGFNFYKILEKIKASDHLLGRTSDWKVNFDWIFENESNYAKILEGNYG